MLYMTTVLIWGSTWIGVKFQLGTVPEAQSVAYRFALASALLAGWCLWRRLPLRFSVRDHAFIALQGLLLFCLNYLLIYIGSRHLTSGLVAVVFSTIVFMNLVNGALLLGQRITARVVAGATLGLIGIALVFEPELAGFGWSGPALAGVAVSLAATLTASFGNMVSARNQRAGLPVVQTNALGMGYGALVMLLWALASPAPLMFEWTARYTLSLVYLALFGSILAFGAYLTLLGRIGAARAAYATVLFPVVALAISTVLEGYQWTVPALVGLVLVLAGNVLVLQRDTPRPALAACPRA